MTNSIIHNALQEHFGFKQFHPGQYEVIKYLMDGHSAAAVFPTGGGKSLCYQLPALLLPGITLVVSPLIALMKDQIDALIAKGIHAQRLDSSLSAEDYRQVITQLREGKLKILYVAPERFNNERFREMIRPLRIALFAVDEAHCISEWGHNFRPDYLKLITYASEFHVERILALTATATAQVLADIRQGFDIAGQHAVRTGFYRANLTLLYSVVNDSSRDRVLLDNLRKQPPGATLIYVTLQKTAEQLADYLQAEGLLCKAYHAGMKDEVRSRIQEWFMDSEQGIVVATIAFGMGVDKANIRYVYHYNLPKSLENYAQEIGRAGRDNLPSTCHTLACAGDLTVLENFIYGDTPDSHAVRALITSLFAHDTYFAIDLYGLSHQVDIRPLVLRTLLTYLELDGYLEGGTPFYQNYSFKPLLSSAQILDQFQGERKAFLAGLFRQAQKAKIWFNIDPSAAAAALQTDRERIVRALDWLAEKNMLEVKVSGVRHRYRQLKKPDDGDLLAEQLFQRMQKRELAELKRLQQVVDLINADSCQTALLAAHFSEVLQQGCGHCSWCMHKQEPMPERAQCDIADQLRKEIGAMLSEQEDARAVLRGPRSLARFLCGITSPAIGRAKLGKHAAFGVLSGIPFHQVLVWAEKLISETIAE